ncbi:MAG: hypothetical protein H6Q31_387 [Bacteroidetes bacterium]|nr:hypothetical protein [Bacteroidota bacterium]
MAASTMTQQSVHSNSFHLQTRSLQPFRSFPVRALSFRAPSFRALSFRALSLRAQFFPTLLLAFMIFLALPFQGCSKQDKAEGSSREAWEAAGREGADEESRKPPMRFRTEVCIDRTGTGKEAFRMLVPADWKFAAGITWILDNPGMPATGWLRATNPALPEELEVFPNQAFFYTDNPLGQQLNPPGSKYFGAEVRTPVGPVQALKSIVLKRFRRSVKNLSVVHEERLPELAAALGVSSREPGVSADGGKIRVKYTKDGTPMEEELYGLIETLAVPIQGMYGTTTNTFWTVSYIFSVKAPQGTLDSLGPLFRTMGSSFRMNPQWLNTYVQVVNFLIQNQIRHIRNTGELSRIISQTHREISDDMQRSWEQRQGVYDRLSERFSQNIRSVDEYYDPVSERSVELPAGYRNAWVNGLGEYVITEQEDYNPNVSSNQNWQRMERRDR